MIRIHYSKKGTPYVWASDLHSLLAIGTPLSKWFPRMIEYGFEENEDYSRHDKFVSSAGGIKKKVFDWAVRIDMAKHIAMIQRTPKGKEIREYLLRLDRKVEEGLLLSREQISALFEICKVMGFFSIQKYFEKEHYNSLEKSIKWWDLRAKLFGYTATDLKEAMQALGRKYTSQRQALMHMDKYELIRQAVCDMFIAMGKSQDYAMNVADFAKSMAQEIKPDIYDDENTPIDFKSDAQRYIIGDLKNYKNNSKVLDKFVYSNKMPSPEDAVPNNLSIDRPTDTNVKKGLNAGKPPKDI